MIELNYQNSLLLAYSLNVIYKIWDTVLLKDLIRISRQNISLRKILFIKYFEIIVSKISKFLLKVYY